MPSVALRLCSSWRNAGSPSGPAQCRQRADRKPEQQGQADADQADVVEAEARFDRGCALDDVLHQQRHGQHQPGDEPAARRVVAAQEDVEPDHQRDRQHHPRRHHQHQRRELIDDECLMVVPTPPFAESASCRREKAGDKVKECEQGLTCVGVGLISGKYIKRHVVHADKGLRTLCVSKMF